MLPKIPYAMHKNKKLSIPFGNFNRSSSFSDGDIYESHNISARKYPYLTTKKANRKLSEYDGRDVEAITVFDGKLVTSQEDGVYIDQKKVFDVEDAHGTRFAPINTKLVVYPDKKYIEKAEGEYATNSLATEVTLNSVVFGPNFIQSSTMVQNCFRMYFDPNLNRISSSNLVRDYYINRAPNKRDSFFVFGDGLISYVKDIGYYHIEQSENHYVITIEATDMSDSIKTDDHIVVQTKNSDYAYGKVAKVVYDEANFLFGTLVTVDLNDNLSDDAVYVYVADNAAQVAFDLKKDDYCFVYTKSGIDENGYDIYTDIAEGKIKTSTVSSVTIDQKSTWMVGFYSNLSFTIPSESSDVFKKLSAGSQISFSSGKNKGPYTVSNVTGGYITLSGDPQIAEDVVTSVTMYITSTDPADEIYADLKVGDAVEISGCSFRKDDGEVDEGEDNNKAFVISKIQKNVIFASADIFTPGESESNITIERRAPDLDFICEKDNRLYGVSNKDKTIYVSALGDPTNMFAYEGVSTDSFAVAVGGEGDFTACCKYGDSVLFFKEDKLYKLTGSYPAEFALYSYDVEGVARDSEKSCVVVNEVLYYHGDKGIYAYSGGIPTLISSNFGEFRGNGAVGGTDGENYYVALWNADADDDTYLFSYNTRLNLWTLEERHPFYVDAARVQGKPLFLTEDGEIYELNLDEDVRNQKWSVQFTPFYETIDGKKSYSRIVMRVSIPMDSYMQIRLRFDGGAWLNAGTVVGKGDSVIPVRIPINRCDKFELELSGKGECTILDIMREYYVSEE